MLVRVGAIRGNRKGNDLMAIRKITIGSCEVHVTHDCNFAQHVQYIPPKTQKFIDYGSPGGATVWHKSAASLGKIVELQIHGCRDIVTLRAGEQARLINQKWVKVVSTNYSMGRGTLLPADADSDFADPVQEPKKCTCGTQSGPDGGICSDYCDLVRKHVI